MKKRPVLSMDGKFSLQVKKPSLLSFPEQVTSLERELRQYKLDADKRNQLPSTDTNDVTNSNSITNHIDSSNLGTNHLKEEIERLKGEGFFAVWAFFVVVALR